MKFKLFPRIRYRRRMLLSYLCIAAVTLTLVSLLMYVSVRSIVSKNTSFSAVQSISQVSDYVSYLMENHKQYALSFSYNNSVWPIVGRKVDNYTLTDQLNDKQTLESQLGSFARYAQTKTRFTCTIYLPDDYSFAGEWGQICKFSTLANTPAYEKMLLNNLTLYSSYEKDLYPGDSIVTIHLIADPTDYAVRPAAFTLSFPADVLREVLKNALPTVHSSCYILDRYGDVVLNISGKEEKEYSSFDMETLRKAIRAGDESIRLDSGSLWARSIPSCNWYIAYTVPDNDIIVSCRPHLWALGIGILAVGVLMLLLSSTLSNAITRRIVCLSNKLGSELHSMPTPIEYEKQGDDIDCLFEQYNAMVAHINNLLTENEETARALSRTELNLLHVQINPHFLFNSLDMLHWMLAEQKYDLVEETISKLSDFYRIGLSKGDMLIPLRDELTHTCSYVDIRNLRFDKTVQLDINIPEQYMDVLLPRITLQPIVENALTHGLQNLSDRSAVLTISAEADGEDLVISICDNGVGIAPEKIPLLLTENTRKLRHYGLYNTNKRLEMHFPGHYGLRIYSIPNKMTQVDIRVPLKGGDTNHV